MISEKALTKKAARYALGVSQALSGRRLMDWAKIVVIIESAYFNGFQSGVVWQKSQKPKKSRR